MRIGFKTFTENNLNLDFDKITKIPKIFYNQGNPENLK